MVGIFRREIIWWLINIWLFITNMKCAEEWGISASWFPKIILNFLSSNKERKL